MAIRLRSSQGSIDLFGVARFGIAVASEKIGTMVSICSTFGFDAGGRSEDKAGDRKTRFLQQVPIPEDGS